MKILLDTNIVIDILSARSPFFQQSFDVFSKILKSSDVPCISASAVTDIVYILRKYILGQQILFQKVQNFLKLVEIEETKRSTVEDAFYSDMNDYEDAVQAQIAIENSINLIITRNAKDFVHSSVPAKTPEDFLAQ